MPYHHAGAYDGFDSIDEAKQYYRRCRTTKHFILSDKAIENGKLICGVCGHPMTVEKGNRCEYLSTNKKVLVMHYRCAWEVIFDTISKLSRAI